MCEQGQMWLAPNHRLARAGRARQASVLSTGLSEPAENPARKRCAAKRRGIESQRTINCSLFVPPFPAVSGRVSGAGESAQSQGLHCFCDPASPSRSVITGVTSPALPRGDVPVLVQSGTLLLTPAQG